MSKIERKYLAHYIDANIFGTSPIYVRLGKDLETYSEELNPQVSIQRNLGGEPFVHMEGYQAQSSVEPFYAEYGSLLFEVLSRIANDRITDDSCKTTKVDVLLNEDGTQVWAYREDCWIVPASIGGDTSGVQIPFNVYCAGNRAYGIFDTTNKTFTEGGEEPPISLFSTLSVSRNGSYSAPAGKGYSKVTVSIPLGYISISKAGTHYASNGSGYNHIYVNNLSSIKVSQNGSYSAPAGTGYSKVTVSVPLTSVTLSKAGVFNAPSGTGYSMVTVSNLSALTVSMNGSYTASSGKGYSYIDVQVPDYVALAERRMYDSLSNSAISLVGSYAFYGCGITGVSFRNCSVIMDHAFDGCVLLSEAYFGASCKTIGERAFGDCQQLEYFLAPTCVSVGYNAFYGCYALSNVTLTSCQKVGAGAFVFCESLESISLYYCNSIGLQAFRGCSSMSVARFGSALSSIDYGTFLSCVKLTSLYLSYSGVVSLKADVSQIFDSTPLYNYSAVAGKWGKIYVHSRHLSSYKADSRWSVISSRLYSM